MKINILSILSTYLCIIILSLMSQRALAIESIADLHETIQKQALKESQEANDKAEKPNREKALVKTIWKTIEMTVIYNQKNYEYQYETTSDKIYEKAEEIRKWTLEQYQPVLEELDRQIGKYIRQYGADSFRDLLIRSELLRWYNKEETPEDAYNRIMIKQKRK